MGQEMEGEARSMKEKPRVAEGAEIGKEVGEEGKKMIYAINRGKSQY